MTMQLVLFEWKFLKSIVLLIYIIGKMSFMNRKSKSIHINYKIHLEISHLIETKFLNVCLS